MDERLLYRRSVSVSPDVLVQELPDGEAIFLDLKTEQYFGLDAVGMRIYTALVASDSVEDAYHRVLREFDVAPDQLRSDLMELVDTLVERRLLEFREP